ncbi:MAG: MliC family protein [Burkholderiaceae bacterium]|nr:MliC family protein [Burkholderiaceae bacterium]
MIFALPFSAAQAKDRAVPVKKEHARYVSKSKAAPARSSVEQSAGDQIATAGHVSSLYQCDLGDKLTIYRNAADSSYVNLRWRNKLYHLSRQKTTTGAERYENRDDGLVLISIPTKSMLFDSKKGRQLANECRNHEQTRRMASRK